MLTVKNHIQVNPDTQYEIIGTASNKRIAYGRTNAADTFDSLLGEYIDYSQAHCTFSTEFIINGIVVATIKII